MLTRIIDWSLRHRWVVLGAAAALVVAGVLAFRDLPIDAFPDTTPMQVQVNTVAPALTPEEVERQLTIPIEQALAGLPRVEELRSISKFGLSQVTLRFADGTDLWFARQQVAERIGRVELPAGVERPSLGPVATGLGEVFHYLVKSETPQPRGAPDAARLGDRAAAPERPGRRRGERLGRRREAVARRRRPAAAAAVRPLARATSTARSRPTTPTSAAAWSSAAAARPSCSASARSTGGRAIEDVVVAARAGCRSACATSRGCEVGHEIRRGATTADGEGEVVLGLGFMLMGENSHEVTAALAKRLDEMKPRLPGDVEVEPVYERTELVDHVLRTVKTNLLEGALLVIAVLFVFLGNVRAGLIVAAAIPLSMLFAFDAMLRFGIAGTLMSLGAIDFGLVVDSSVIMVENAERRLAEAKGERSGGRDRARRGRRGAQADAVRRAHHHDRVPPDPHARGGRGEAVPADGAHRHLRAGRLGDPVDDADAGARVDGAAAPRRRPGAP